MNESCPQNIIEATTYKNITILRTHGLFGIVTVRWEIKHLNGSLAVDDFLFANGSVMFREHEVKKVSDRTTLQ